MADIEERISKLDLLIAQAEEKKTHLANLAEADAKIIAAYSAGATVSEIAATLEDGVGNIYYALRRAGVQLRGDKKGRKGKPKTSQRDAEIIEAHERGYTLEQIGNQFSITRERVRQILVRAGVTDRNGFEGRQAATEIRDAKIATDYVGGAKFADLAVMHGLSYSTVKDLMRQHPISREAYMARVPRRIKTSKARQLAPTFAEAYRAGATVKEISAAYGISVTSVYNRLKEHGCEMRRVGRSPTKARGSFHSEAANG